MLFEAEKLFSDLRNKKDVSRERIDPFITKAKSNPNFFQGVIRDASPEMRIAQDEQLDENTTIADIQDRLSGLRPTTSKPLYTGHVETNSTWLFRLASQQINSMVTLLLPETSPRLAEAIQGVIDAIQNMTNTLDDELQASAVEEVPQLSKDENVDTEI